jgi:2-(1,2-epoxy-1,2-dihydrophenyl)acetyl-CoA isomerase
MSESEVVTTKMDGAVLEIAMNRTDRLNAMNQELIEGLQVSLASAHSERVRAVLLRAEGRGFSVGGDIKMFAESLEQTGGVPAEMPDALHDVIERVCDLPKPVLALVHGACAGAGMSLMMACDLAIAADDAKFALAYTGIGISPDGSSTFFLPRIVGWKKATEIFMTAGRMTAAEVHELGLVNRVVAPDQLLDVGRTYAKMLAAGPTQAYGRLKSLLRASYGNSLHDQLALETQHLVETSKTEDFKGGVTSFLAKQVPTFQGK